ncbi:MAG: diaminopimelate decarboxylase [Chloroflexota bacterium]|nr:diaminopimelate decarboxylase [Chloroflexota bacterium]
MTQHSSPQSNQRRLALFPITTAVEGYGSAARLTIAGCDVGALAAQHGTPLYLYDQATMDAAVAAYRQALARYYATASGITYAGKAFLCVAAAQWVQQQALWLDCTGAGELSIAAAAGVERSNILVHGVNKSQADLAAALVQAHVIVVDNLSELNRLAAAWQTTPNPALALWLRVRPGVAVATHSYRQTGQEDSKFGFGPQEAQQAVAFCQHIGLPLTGLHFHQGSHFHDPAPIGPALDIVLDLIAKLRVELGWLPTVLCPGGGWGVAYHEDELPHPAIENYVAFIAQRLTTGCQQRGLPLPRLQLEPGRSLVAQAGVAIYQVGAIKQTVGRRWLLIDGGLADNARPALYGARYSALPVHKPLRPNVGPAWVAGPYCESGDVMIQALDLPLIAADEWLAVPVSGAYHLAMGSNYNGACRPAVLWLRAGEAHLIQRRERLDELAARDQPLPQITQIKNQQSV